MSQARDQDDDLHRMLQLREEHLVVGKQTRATLVKIATVTDTRDQIVDEELLRDDVVLDRVAIGRIVDAVPPARTENGVIILPVVVEELVTVRRLVLKEEIHLRRARTTERHTEVIRLRRQQATVTRTTIDVADCVDPFPSHPPQSLARKEHPMNDEMIVAVFDTAEHAEAAVYGLEHAGIPVDNIEMHRGGGATTAAPVRPQGFWASIFGGEPDHDTGVYDRSIDGGSTVVSIRVAAGFVARATEILELHHPIDIDERATSYGLSTVGTAAPAVARPATTGTVAAATADTIQLSEENLAVGKRVVNHGGTRIRRFVVETPVEQSVTLHDERVVLDRRPVTDGRPVGVDDFSDKTIEMTETAEEAVVSKTAHVYEEVGLRKEVTDRTETIRDTLRREEVEIERVPGSGPVDSSFAAPRTPKI